MPHDSSSNAPASGRTSPSAPSDRESKPAPPASESAFLTKQAADAKSAIARVSEEIKQDLAKGVDPRAWMQVAPWTTLASAAVAGFLAAAATIPSKEQQALRRLRRMEKALEEEEYDRTHPDDHGRRNGRNHSGDSGKGSMMGAVMGSLLAAVQPVLVSVLNNAMGRASAGQQPPSGGAATGTTSPPSQDASDGGANQV